MIENDGSATSPAATPRAPAQFRLRARLRHKLPEILIEAGSIVLAILLAFAVDEWRERRAQLAVAERARRTIVSELKANRSELRGTRGANAQTLENISKQVAAFGDGPVTSVQTNMNLSQLSAAAFQTAQATEAAQFLDFEWLVQVGRTYELQRTYVSTQDSALVEVGGSGGAIANGEHPRAVLQRVESRLRTLQMLADGLLAAYDETIGK
jgi:hypothetical protein